MSDGLTPGPPPGGPVPPAPWASPEGWAPPPWAPTQVPDGTRGPWVRASLLMAATILVLFAAAGVGCGLLWWHMWSPPAGTVEQHQFLLNSEKGLRASFDSTAIYTVVGAGAGLLLGFVCSWLLTRSEAVGLIAVLLGAVLASWLMLRVGLSQSAPDPTGLAKTAADGTRLSGRLAVTGYSAYLVWPGFALLATAFVYFVLPARRPRRAAS